MKGEGIPVSGPSAGGTGMEWHVEVAVLKPYCTWHPGQRPERQALPPRVMPDPVEQLSLRG